MTYYVKSFLQGVGLAIVLLFLAGMCSGCVMYNQGFKEPDGTKYGTMQVGIGYKVKQDNSNLKWVWNTDGSGQLEIQKVHEGMDALQGFQSGLLFGQTLGEKAIGAAVPIATKALELRDSREN